ncbi:CHAT domain-containing protein [Actinoplanes sp. LDG1-06]|uniref:CHAT domain-containing protein n=1 Tax=Paractinoplanes ovalisporus TaxID=2810368 RepID=A0ABS2A8W2_9ACTN|nr:CHAT domain-containing protein [Actinoplanes ovalisporus]MBM2616271.1 CHAT domain-containing protein [Actinoplanes ovalisporus]
MRRLRAALRLTGAGDPAARGRVLVTLAWAEAERGRVDLGHRLLDQAEELTPEAGRPVLHAQRAALFNRNGRADLAMPWFDRAIAGLSERDDPLDLAKVLNNRGMLHLESGRAGPARDDMTRALRLCRRHGIEVGTALLEVNLACLDVVRGDLPSALGGFAAARVTYERVVPGRLPTLAVERARALVAAGLFQAADAELAFAVEQGRSQGQDNTVAEALHVRAEAALLAGRSAAAAGWAEQARTAFVRRGNPRRAALAALLGLRASPPSKQVATRARRLATELRRLGLAEDARVALLTASRVIPGPAPASRLIPGPAPASPLTPGPAPASPLTPGPAPASPLTPGPAPAFRLTPGLTVGAGRHDRLDTRLLRRLVRAEQARAAGRPAEAGRELAAGMAALHRHRARFGCLDLQTGASAHGHDLAAAGLAAALESGSPAAVHRWSERSRAQALLLPPARPPDDPAVAAALEDLRQTRSALRAAELEGRSAGSLRGRAETLERQIRESAWSQRGVGSGGPVLASLAAVRAGLGGAALVAYVRNRDRLEALVITASRATVTPVGEWTMAEEAVLRLRADLDTAAGRALPKRLAVAVAEATRRDAEALEAAVLGPISALIGDRDLVVVPTGVLMTAPWAALPACAGRPVTVAPSATAWLSRRPAAGSVLMAGPGNEWADATHREGEQVRVELSRRPAAGPVLVAGPGNESRRRGDGPVLVAGPGNESRRRFDGPTVLVAGPGNDRGADEIADIAALYPQAVVLTGDRAGPAATLAALDGAGLAHLAAHGRHEAENALFSALELAGGPVLGYDLQRLGRAPGLVVLSSCELGLSEVRPGDETFGMASALLAAGTATVVASVARVADEQALDVMAGFHRALAAGNTAAAALAGAAAGTAFVCLGGS